MLFRRRHRQTVLQRLRDFLWPGRRLHRGWLYVWHRVKRISASPHAIALGFAAGAFASFTPYVGFHFLIAGLIALALGGSIIASAFGTCVGNPLTFPLIWYATYNLGSLLLGHGLRSSVELDLPQGMFLQLLSDPVEFWRSVWGQIGRFILPMTVGSIPVGLAVSAVIYYVVRAVVTAYQNRRQSRFVRERLQ